MTAPHIIVVDLDGTLCNSAHREHLARAGQWDDFHSLLLDDEPWPDVRQFLDMICNGTGEMQVVGLTGRNERYRMMTLKWLGKHQIYLDALLMRPDSCYLSDTEIKPQLLDGWLDEKGMTHADVMCILEDRDKMVEEWRNLGHNCWQCRPGGY